MNIESLIANETSVGSLARAQSDMFGVILTFWPIQATFVAKEPLCDLGIPSRALITLLRVI